MEARVTAGAGMAAIGRTWHAAVQLPGIRGGGNADIESLSCGSSGNCSAGGTYSDGKGDFQAFVASEVNGRWRNAIEVPGTAALNKGWSGGNNASAVVTSVSCRAAVSCTALGSYTDASGFLRAFVASKS